MARSVAETANEEGVPLSSSPRDTLGLKRAYSAPLEVRDGHSPSKSKLSTKPSFKISLPPFKLFGSPSPAGSPRPSLLPHRPWSKSADDTSEPQSRPQEHLPIAFGDPALLTPPDETILPTWNMESSRDLQPEAVESVGTPTTPDVMTPNPEMSATTSSIGQERSDAATSSTGENQAGPSNNDGARESSDATAEGILSWLDAALKVTLSGILREQDPRNAVKVVCQSHPFPAEELQDVVPTTAFQSLMVALQTNLQSNPTRCITVFHALPPQFTLAKLPTSPPGTPSGAVSESTTEDYFNVRIFSSAVPIYDRHDLYNPSNMVLPSTPGLAVPPSSVDIALYERFIPPATVKEFLDLFEPTGPSALVDRLVELSRGGTLLFIYPTKKGADDFVRDYLGPLLEPLLRHIIWDRGLSADIGSTVGKMPSVDYLEPYDVLAKKVKALLRGLSRATTERSEYELLYASKQTIQVQRKVWEQWWLHQERPRVESVMTEYVRRGKNLPKVRPESAVLAKGILENLPSRTLVRGEVDAVGLANEILEGLPRTSYPSRNKTVRVEGTGEGLEVGVFVIRRGG